MRNFFEVELYCLSFLLGCEIRSGQGLWQSHHYCVHLHTDAGALQSFLQK